MEECREKTRRRSAAPRGYKGTTGVGCDGFHPRVPLVFERHSRISGELLRAGRAEWEAARTSLHDVVFFLSPKNITSERPIALHPR